MNHLWGGANIIEKIKCKNRIGSDNNKYLIALWKAFQNGFNPPEFIDRELYYKVKDNKELFDDEFVGLVGICAAYNGNWFSSYGGYSQTKTGKDRNYYQEALSNIDKQLSGILTVEFYHRDYTYYSNYKNCVIYCDPPYQKNTRVYNDKLFNHEKFWEWVRLISLNNIVFVSEYSAPNDFKIIWEKQLSKMFPKQKNNTPTEKLFIYNGK